MNLAPEILGQTAVRRLQETQAHYVLEIGTDKFTRKDLSGVECYNFHAARLLTGVLRELRVKNTKQLFEEIPPRALCLPHLGVVSLAVLGAAFEAKGLGGSAPLSAYVRKHAPAANGHRLVVTFDTMKHREHRRELEASQHARRRSRR